MNQKLINRSLIPVSLLVACSAMGQTAPTETTIRQVTLEPATEPMLNRFTFSFRPAFNISAKFKNIGAFPAQSDPGSTASRTNHFYDDGYVLVDVTTNNHQPGFDNHTWYWGYQNDSQYDPEANTISMHSSSSQGARSGSRGDDPQPGFEFTYSREFYRDEGWRVGLLAAFGYTDVEISDSRPLSAITTRLTDVYQVPEGFFPPSAPYSGSYEGPGAVISDTPSRSIESGSAPVSGKRFLGADLFGFRLGPYVEIPLNRTVSVSLEAGVSLVYVHSLFRHNDVVSTDAGPVAVSGGGKHDDILVGGYAGGSVSVALNEQWTAFAGAQWQDVGTYTHRSRSGVKAVLDLSQTVFLSVGLGYSF